MNEVAEGIYFLKSKIYGDQVWTVCDLKRRAACKGRSELMMKGETALKPVTKKANRAHRLHECGNLPQSL